MTGLIQGLLWAASCTGGDGEDPSGGTGDTRQEGAAEAWPDTGLEWTRGITLIHGGQTLASGAVIAAESAPAGIAQDTVLHFVLTNRRDESLSFGGDADMWMDGGAFSWAELPPSTLGPGESAPFSLRLSPADYSNEAWPARELRIPTDVLDFTVTLEIHVPRPLRTVVAGDGGYTLVSDSYGADFEEAGPASSDTPLQALAWGEGVFVRSLSGDAAAFEFSADGIVWQEARSEPAGTVSDCAYGLGRFVCVRSDTITWSDDGTDFVHADTFHDYELNTVVFSHDRFVAAGEGGRKAYSLDGLIWNGESFSGSPDAYHGITAGQDTLVAVGGMNRYFVSASVDGGESWTAVPFGNCPQDRLATVSYSGGVFLAQGESTCHHNMHRSEDGVIWAPVFGVQPFDRYELLGTVNGWFIAQKQEQDGAAGLYRSEDGDAWEKVHTLPEGVLARKMAAEAWP